MFIEEKLRKMGYSLKDFDRVSKKPFETVMNINQILYVSGHASKFKDELVYKGIIGRDVTVEEGQKSIIYAFLNCLVAIKNEVKDLDLIEQFINLRCYVAITEEYYSKMSEISDNLTYFINELFEDKGKHTRTTIGVSVLPGNAPVEVDLILKVKEEVYDQI